LIPEKQTKKDPYNVLKFIAAMHAEEVKKKKSKKKKTK